MYWALYPPSRFDPTTHPTLFSPRPFHSVSRVPAVEKDRLKKLNNTHPGTEFSSNSFFAALKAFATDEAAPASAPITSTVEAATSCPAGDLR